MNISESLQKAIQENLPQLVGTELQQFIQDANRTSELYAKLKQENESLRDWRDKAAKQIDGLEKLQLRKEILDEKERDLKVAVAESKADNSQALAKQAFEMVSLVFHNPIVTKLISDTESKYVAGHAGNNWQGHNEGHNKNYTEIQETK